MTTRTMRGHDDAETLNIKLKAWKALEACAARRVGRAAGRPRRSPASAAGIRCDGDDDETESERGKNDDEEKKKLLVVMMVWVLTVLVSKPTEVDLNLQNTGSFAWRCRSRRRWYWRWYNSRGITSSSPNPLLTFHSLLAAPSKTVNTQHSIHLHPPLPLLHPHPLHDFNTTQPH